MGKVKRMILIIGIILLILLVGYFIHTAKAIGF